MVNIDDFIKRLEIILDYYNLTASSFADKINVQRSSLSHLLSGRNKPSLDFIIKVIDVFPEVDLYWILNGKGSFPKSEKNVPLILETEKTISSSPILESSGIEHDLFSSVENNTPIYSEKSNTTSFDIENSNSDEIERIVIFFKNGTFKNYKP